MEIMGLALVLGTIALIVGVAKDAEIALYLFDSDSTSLTLGKIAGLIMTMRALEKILWFFSAYNFVKHIVITFG